MTDNLNVIGLRVRGDLPYRLVLCLSTGVLYSFTGGQLDGRAWWANTSAIGLTVIDYSTIPLGCPVDLSAVDKSDCALSLPSADCSETCCGGAVVNTVPGTGRSGSRLTSAGVAGLDPVDHCLRSECYGADIVLAYALDAYYIV